MLQCAHQIPAPKLFQIVKLSNCLAHHAPQTSIASYYAVVHKEMEDAHDAHTATMADKMARFAALKEQYSALEARVPEELARLAAAMLAAVEEGEDAVAAKLRELDGKLAKGKKGATKGRGDVLALLQQLAAAM